MPINATEIEQLIRQSFPDAQIIVQGDDGQHFAAEVVDESFRGMNRVQQQRAVNAAIRAKLDSGELHALALTTRAPD
ncbi:MAG: BolA/IbaG family iron-sulfur metabolism protein [Marinovum algicola]|jgi:acid stress-induced BolA-like protein IbaG/YrbA|uniref:YrbA protein n=1 Tax=Marinovum algicola TaxID=42444 RepID=A0A975ZMP8_9RHOB|nr:MULTISPECIES: BolA/IbaG family iron-sulfur metabolism protein [Marinovum]AKO97108.1 Stress-induced morphogen (activity unknown) [Marinovum algicola DG 898]MDD9739937.1 BolA/IbaG family iron-sulfur metabolism protein [Marinovum sp. SP66]MDD9742528.1 BolA/IbaG family iron-sulfur metabolism protein [Marinovum sp. PR37]SEJ13414.1 Stress-induced morphogen (activity unknown) [Marinovum algicola]SLN21600.1 BolA-like protein [Marinovum algicola]